MIATEIVPDDAALRFARRDRVLAAMEEHDVDVLVLGREANARYVSGVPRLWLAGTRPFGAGCVLVRATGAIHLLTTWDEGVPEEIPHDHLIGYTFNPGNVLRALQAIDGSSTFRRVATDALSPSSAGMLPQAFPAATIVDGEQLMRGVRRTKLPAEIDAIRHSVSVAEHSLAAAVAALRPGITERALTGVFMTAMARTGVCMPSVQDVAWISSTDQPWRRTNRDVPTKDGDLVTFEAGVMVDAYAGELARTHVVGETGPSAAALLRVSDELVERLVGACRPGAPVTDLLRVYEDAGVAAPPMPVAHGLGLGNDDPLVSPDLPRLATAARFEPGMVLAVTAFVWEQGVGAALTQEPLVVTDDGAELLSTTARRPG